MASDSTPPVPLEALLSEAAWLSALARSLVRDPSAADDLVQETWLAALRHPPQADRPLRPWLRKVLENFARIRRRGEGARVRRELAHAVSEAQAPDADLVERVEEQRFLAREVLQLDEPFRSALLLRYYEGLTSEQIAVRVGSNDNTVRWRMKRGLELLRERLDRRHGGDRRAWLALLAPLPTPGDAATAPASVPTSAPAASSSAAAAGWIAVAGTLLLAGAWWITRAPVGDPTSLAVAPLQSAPPTSTQGPAIGARSPSPVEARETSASRLRVARAFGVVVDDSGAAVADATLELRARDSAELLASALSGADGYFELTLSRARRAGVGDVLHVAAPGHLPSSLHAPLSHYDELPLGFVELQREASLSGVVLDEHGRALSGATVAVEAIGARWPGEREPPLEEARLLGSLLDDSAPAATSDGAGRYEVRGLRAGYVRLWARASGREGAWSPPVALEAGRRAQAPAFALAELDPARCIDGLVLDGQGHPVADAEIEAARASLRRDFFRGRSGVLRARSDEHGRFRIAAEPGGNYDLAARHANRLATRSWSVGDAAQATLVLRDPAPWVVRLQDRSGRSLDDARVELSVRDAVSRALLHGAAARLESGRLTVMQDHWRAFALELLHADGAASSGALDPEQPASELVLALEPLRALEVHVSSAGGAPLADALVELFGADRPARAWTAPEHGGPELRLEVDDPELVLARSRTDERGRAVLRFWGGTRGVLRVTASGWPSATSAPLDLATTDAHDIELRNGGAVGGRVSGASGVWVAGAVVCASRGVGIEAVTTVAADGAYALENLAPGAWQVRLAPLPGSERAGAGSERDPRALSDDVVVLEGERIGHDVALGETGACRLRGRATLDGAAPGACVVEVTRPGRPRVLARAWADPSGRFELVLREAGAFELRVDSIERNGPRFELRAPLTLTIGENSFHWSERSAALEVHAPVRHRNARVIVRCATDAGGSFEAHAPLDGEGRAELRLPARRVTVELDDGACQPLELELRPGERVPARLVER